MTQGGGAAEPFQSPSAPRFGPTAHFLFGSRQNAASERVAPNPHRPSSLTVRRTVEDGVRWAAIDWFGLRAKTKRRAGEAKAVCRLIACMENTCAIISRPVPVASPHLHGGAGGGGVDMRPAAQGGALDSGSILAAWHRFLAVGHVTTPRADQLTLKVAPNCLCSRAAPRPFLRLYATKERRRDRKCPDCGCFIIKVQKLL